MLRKETVSESTLELLKTLMKDELLGNFFLAGGTALALQIGHRISIDLDLFTEASFNENEMLTNLEERTEPGLKISLMSPTCVLFFLFPK